MTRRKEASTPSVLQTAVAMADRYSSSSLSLEIGAGAGRPDSSARRRMWEVMSGSHCSIIGTCLTLGELRRLARRTGFLPNEARYNDYQVHGLFVEQMSGDNAVSRATQKHLDSKFEGAIRKARSLDDDHDFLAYWEAAVDNGFVPGAYWALVTHPRLSAAAGARIFADVHMMSHICGASHRGDARAIGEARREKADLARRLTGLIAERNEEIRRQRGEIERLTKLVRALEPMAEECARLKALLETEQQTIRLGALEREVEASGAENAELRKKLARNELQREHLKARLDALSNFAGVAQRQAPISQSPDESETPIEEDDLPDDLCGRCLLYVGGRPRTVCRLKQLVARHNGSLLHHDGGIEHTPAILGDLVKRADAVLFPVDCVSHRAAGIVKTLCESHGIPYCPLRSASVAAFQKAIRHFGSERALRSRPMGQSRSRLPVD